MQHGILWIADPSVYLGLSNSDFIQVSLSRDTINLQSIFPYFLWEQPQLAILLYLKALNVQRSCQEWHPGTWLDIINLIKNDFKIDFYFTLIRDYQASFSTIFQVKFHYMISQFHNLDITAKIDFNSICLIAVVLRSNELNASHVRSTHTHSHIHMHTHKQRHTLSDTGAITKMAGQ